MNTVRIVVGIAGSGLLFLSACATSGAASQPTAAARESCSIVETNWPAGQEDFDKARTSELARQLAEGRNAPTARRCAPITARRWAPG